MRYKLFINHLLHFSPESNLVLLNKISSYSKFIYCIMFRTIAVIVKLNLREIDKRDWEVSLISWISFDDIVMNDLDRYLFSSTQSGEITVYRLAETACQVSIKCRTPCRKKQTWLPTETPPRKTRPKTPWAKA